MCSNAFHHNTTIDSFAEELACRIFDDVKHVIQHNAHVAQALKVCNDVLTHFLSLVSDYGYVS